MTCQSGKFIIDLTQDFSTDKYVNALRKQFEKAGIDAETSGKCPLIVYFVNIQ